jgi:hypothetical protein
MSAFIIFKKQQSIDAAVAAALAFKRLCADQGNCPALKLERLGG